MTVWTRGAFSVAGFAATAVLLAGCAGSQPPINTIRAPQQLSPVATSIVATNSLPAIGVQGTPAPGLMGQPMLGGVAANPSMNASATGTLPTLGASTQVAAANTNSSFVSLDPLAQPAAGAIGTGPEGAWTVLSGATQCRLNLPLTAKTGTTKYRASAPGCALPGLATVASWQQVGNQVQIFDENNTMVAAVAKNGGGYIGTTSGGQGISLIR
ncbi:AprI/Inh family metalloprotease inhibitor [Devosia sp.]|uniref:AprI/Inh family metalloprotease inhibitor n=1 Tax=Devosia sp. TaxID=1871048 RepID=UPI003263958A